MASDFEKALNGEEGEEQGDFNETFSAEVGGDLEYDESAPLNIIGFTLDGIGLPIYHKLLCEGCNVVVAQIQSKKDLGEEEGEDAEAKRRRLSQYDGILDKQDGKKVLKAMAKIPNKGDWIVFFDFNHMGAFAEKCLEMGFTKGLFPTKEDTALEKDRNSAKEIVKKHYEDLTVAEVSEFRSVKDGISFLEETEQIWVLKGNGDSEGAKTIVPWNDDPELAKQILIDALESHSKDYEDGGFILEEKIIGGYELTPQIVFLDGEVVFTDIDIENKNIGCGNMSVQTGAMQTLVIKSDIGDRINELAFPKWIYDMAKDHKGLFVADAGLICKDGEYYFTEFCFQRFGYDSFFAEIAMSGSATGFFSKVFSGENPLKSDFGVAVRGMNLHKDGKERRVLEGISMMTRDDESTFIFECKVEDDRLVSTGTGWDMVVFTGAADTVNEASEKAYGVADGFAFEDLYFRPQFDFLSFDYQNSIPNRFTELNHDLFEATDMEKDEKYRIGRLESKVREALKKDAQE